jgi:hypothetical protein
VGGAPAAPLLPISGRARLPCSSLSDSPPAPAEDPRRGAAGRPPPSPAPSPVSACPGAEAATCPGGPSPAAVRCRDPRSSLCLRRWRRQGKEGDTATELPPELVAWKRSSSRGGGNARSRGGGAPLLPLRRPTEEQEPQLAPTVQLLPLPTAVPSPDFPPRRRRVELLAAEDVEQQWRPAEDSEGEREELDRAGPAPRLRSRTP